MVSGAYAALRYIGFGDVSGSQLPLYVANKSVAYAGLALLALAFLAAPLGRRFPGLAALGLRAHELGRAGLALTALHVALSVALLAPTYYPALFDESGHYTTLGGVGMLAGAVALVALLAQGRTPVLAPDDPGRARLTRLGALVLAATLVHQVGLGWPGWTTPGQWPGGLPPITLLSALTAGAALALGARR